MSPGNSLGQTMRIRGTNKLNIGYSWGNRGEKDEFFALRPYHSGEPFLFTWRFNMPEPFTGIDGLRHAVWTALMRGQHE
jgi:hypothetical protein